VGGTSVSPTTIMRDTRDPKDLGEKLLAARLQFNLPLSAVYDYLISQGLLNVKNLWR